MERMIRNILLLIACVCACACAKDGEDEPEIALFDVSGVWQETAYLCSDGYFVPVYGLGAMNYEFAIPNIYSQYTLDESGNKDVYKQGEWEYNPETKCVHVTEPRGWNLDIYFTFGEKNNATLDIRGRTTTSNSTVKVKRLTK